MADEAPASGTEPTLAEDDEETIGVPPIGEQARRRFEQFNPSRSASEAASEARVKPEKGNPIVPITLPLSLLSYFGRSVKSLKDDIAADLAQFRLGQPVKDFFSGLGTGFQQAAMSFRDSIDAVERMLPGPLRDEAFEEAGRRFFKATVEKAKRLDAKKAAFAFFVASIYGLYHGRGPVDAAGLGLGGAASSVADDLVAQPSQLPPFPEGFAEGAQLHPLGYLEGPNTEPFWNVPDSLGTFFEYVDAANLERIFYPDAGFWDLARPRNLDYSREMEHARAHFSPGVHPQRPLNSSEQIELLLRRYKEPAQPPHKKGPEAGKTFHPIGGAPRKRGRPKGSKDKIKRKGRKLPKATEEEELEEELANS